MKTSPKNSNNKIRLTTVESKEIEEYNQNQNGMFQSFMNNKSDEYDDLADTGTYEKRNIFLNKKQESSSDLVDSYNIDKIEDSEMEELERRKKAKH